MTASAGLNGLNLISRNFPSGIQSFELFSLACPPISQPTKKQLKDVLLFEARLKHSYADIQKTKHFVEAIMYTSIAVLICCLLKLIHAVYKMSASNVFFNILGPNLLILFCKCGFCISFVVLSYLLVSGMVKNHVLQAKQYLITTNRAIQVYNLQFARDKNNNLLCELQFSPSVAEDWQMELNLYRNYVRAHGGLEVFLSKKEGTHNIEENHALETAKSRRSKDRMSVHSKPDYNDSSSKLDLRNESTLSSRASMTSLVSNSRSSTEHSSSRKNQKKHQ